MKNILKLLVCTGTILLFSCEKDNTPGSFLNEFKTNKYYEEEIIPDEFLPIYGLWELYDATGGFHGQGHEPNYDYLEIKSIGIYAIIRNDSVLVYGKIEHDTTKTQLQNMLKIKLVPEYYVNHQFHDPREYIELTDNNSLILSTRGPDDYFYHYKRMK